MKKAYLQTKEVDSRKFYYVDFGNEGHGRSSFRLWVHYSLVKKDKEDKPHVEFPLVSATLSQGKSQYTVIARPGNNVIYDIFVKCGYRGYGKVEKFNHEPNNLFTYYIYSSPRGNLGISEGYLVELPKDTSLTYKWHKSGRLYGKPADGTTIVYPDGRIEDIEETDLCEIEDLAE